jgi:hypothetical protein
MAQILSVEHEEIQKYLFYYTFICRVDVADISETET